MSNSSSLAINLTITALTLTTTGLLMWYWWWKEQKATNVPSKWRQVGELGEILVYPVKSLGACPVDRMECTVLGLKSDWLRDRCFMVVDKRSHFMSARLLPRMVLVKPSFNGPMMMLAAPGMPPLYVDLEKVYKSPVTTGIIWGQTVVACDCGDEAARWISQFLYHEPAGLRLFYYPLRKATRQVRGGYRNFPHNQDVDYGAYPDLTSYSLVNEASVDDLNTRLKEPIKARQFRNNFVIKGAKPYDEDNWEWIKIGESVFRNTMPCTRCLLTTIDPDTGVMNKRRDPLDTLKTYRQLSDPKIRSAIGESPAMGLHLGFRGKEGELVKVGDPVYVGL